MDGIVTIMNKNIETRLKLPNNNVAWLYMDCQNEHISRRLLKHYRLSPRQEQECRENGQKLKNCSWMLTGTSGRGKSTSLLICAASWFADRSKCRVLYLPAFDFISPLESAIWKCLAYTFHGDSILPLLLNLGEDNYHLKFCLIDAFLQSQGLYLVIVLDQINYNCNERDVVSSLDLFRQSE